MIIKADTRAFTVQLIVVNIFAVVIGVAAHFLAGSFLITFFVSLVVFNLAWFFIVYKKKRIQEIELNKAKDTLKLTYNGSHGQDTIPFEQLKLTFEKVKNHNENMVTVLAIYDSSDLVNKIRPGMTGFDLDSLKALVSRYEAYISEKATP